MSDYDEYERQVYTALREVREKFNLREVTAKYDRNFIEPATVKVFLEEK